MGWAKSSLEKAEKWIKSDSELRALLALCEEKHCWLADLNTVPSDELPLWIAYYNILKKERKSK